MFSPCGFRHCPPLPLPRLHEWPNRADDDRKVEKCTGCLSKFGLLKRRVSGGSVERRFVPLMHGRCALSIALPAPRRRIFVGTFMVAWSQSEQLLRFAGLHCPLRHPRCVSATAFAETSTVQPASPNHAPCRPVCLLAVCGTIVWRTTTSINPANFRVSTSL